MKFKRLAAILAAMIITSAITLSACNDAPDNVEQTPENTPVQPDETTPPDNSGEITPEVPDDSTPEVPEVPVVETVTYFKITSDSVNIRSGAGAGYAVVGVAERNTLYILVARNGNWLETQFKGKRAFISAVYTVTYKFEKKNEKVESVIEEGAKLLGTKYVYGAVRYHNGSGKLLSGFTLSQFDCSSLTQYIFYKGAGVNLDVTTRTQVVQGKSVASLERGDLMFFTNESRKHLTGVERIGHVALYLGDNYILHTASDYAKIEQISSGRWNNFIVARRMV